MIRIFDRLGQWGTNPFTVAASGADKIDGESSVTLSQPFGQHHPGIARNLLARRRLGVAWFRWHGRWIRSRSADRRMLTTTSSMDSRFQARGNCSAQRCKQAIRNVALPLSAQMSCGRACLCAAAGSCSAGCWRLLQQAACDFADDEWFMLSSRWTQTLAWDRMRSRFCWVSRPRAIWTSTTP